MGARPAATGAERRRILSPIEPDTMKKHGIRFTIPLGDPMQKLLGENWEAFRWYDTAQERDQAFEELRRQPPYYRQGDLPTQILSKVDR